jgi:hypothetical protein
LVVSYTVRWSDFVWMYLGSWGARIAAVPGIVFMLIPIGESGPLAQFLFFEVAGLALAIGGLLYVCVGLLIRHGVGRVVGKTVTIQLDGEGISGWSLAGDLDCSWWRVRKAYRVHGVTCLPFRHTGTHAAWVAIPDRALTKAEQLRLRDILAARA